MYTDSADDYLDVDPEIPSQQYALMSVLAPLSVKSAPNFDWSKKAVKIRGGFTSLKATKPRKTYLYDINSYHHIFECQVGAWLGWDNNAETFVDAIADTGRLNQLVKMKKEQDERVRKHDIERKDIATKNAEKQRKMMKKRQKKRSTEAVENEIGHDLVGSNIATAQEMTQEELEKKIKILNNPINENLEPTNDLKIDDKVQVKPQVQTQPQVSELEDENEEGVEHDDDPIIPSQQWVILSVITSESVTEAKELGWDFMAIKIRGFFENEEDAESRKEYLGTIDPYQPVFSAPVGRWLNWTDDPDSAEEVVYSEPKLQELLNMNKMQTAKVKEHENERKTTARANAIRHKKLMDRQKEREKAKGTIKTTDEILGQEIISENMVKMHNLSVEEMQSNMIEMRNQNVTDVPDVDVPNTTNVETKETKIEKAIKHVEENEMAIKNQENTVNEIEQEYLNVQKRLAELKNKK